MTVQQAFENLTAPVVFVCSEYQVKQDDRYMAMFVPDEDILKLHIEGLHYSTFYTPEGKPGLTARRMERPALDKAKIVQTYTHEAFNNHSR